MATLTWTKGNTAFDTGLGGSLTDGDSVFFREGGDIVTANLNQSGFDCLLMKFAPECSVSFPNVTRFDADVSSTGHVYIGGSGDIYNFGGGTTGVWNKATVALKKPGAKVLLSLMTLSTLVVESGLVIASSDADVNDAWIFGGELVLDEAAATFANIYCLGGACRIYKRDGTNIYIGGNGLVICDGSVITPVIVEMNGGRLDYNGANVGTFRGRSGVLDRTRAERDVTLSAGENTPGLTIIKSPAGFLTVVTGLTTIGSGSKQIVV